MKFVNMLALGAVVASGALFAALPPEAQMEREVNSIQQSEEFAKFAGLEPGVTPTIVKVEDGYVVELLNHKMHVQIEYVKSEHKCCGPVRYELHFGDAETASSQLALFDPNGSEETSETPAEVKITELAYAPESETSETSETSEPVALVEVVAFNGDSSEETSEVPAEVVTTVELACTPDSETSEPAEPVALVEVVALTFVDADPSEIVSIETTEVQA
jgi:hypothetical protein